MKLWFLTIRNGAETDEPGDAELSDIVLPLPPDEALSLVERVASGVPRGQIVESLRPLLVRFKEERLTGEGFGDFCRRLGPEAVRSLVPAHAE